MQALRSLVFNIFFMGLTAIAAVAGLVLMPFSRELMHKTLRNWCQFIKFGLKWIVGIDHEIRGRENIPAGPAIFSSKHQSAWETFMFFTILDGPVYILKQELVKFPILNWYAKKSGMIAVDRQGGGAALKKMIRDARQRLDEGHSVIIFPEGTRAKPGTRNPYHPGIAALYSHCKVPVVPVALNSGLFWGRRAFTKQPGRIIVEFLPKMETGLKSRAFMTALEKAQETASAALIEETIKRFPHTAKNVSLSTE